MNRSLVARRASAPFKRRASIGCLALMLGLVCGCRDAGNKTSNDTTNSNAATPAATAPVTNTTPITIPGTVTTLPIVVGGMPPTAADTDGDGIANDQDQCDARVFGGRAALSDAVSIEIRNVFETDIDALLERVAGRSINWMSATAVPSSGACNSAEVLRFVRADDPSVAAMPATWAPMLAQLRSGSKQAYALLGDAKQGYWVVASTDRGLLHGAYGLLDRLGVRFLLPGDLWIDAPRRADLRFTGAEYRAPAFDTLAYFGSAGWGGESSRYPIAEVGEDGVHAKAMAAWWRRLAYPQGKRLGGHSWEEFTANTTVRSAMEQNQHMRACIPCAPADTACMQGATDQLCGDRNGVPYRRVPLGSPLVHSTHHGESVCGSASAPRTCASGEPGLFESTSDFTSNSGLARLFSDWSLERLARSKDDAARDPALTPTVSVDPADGENYCQCDKCRGMTTHGADGYAGAATATQSDTVFHLANHVARRIAAQTPAGQPVPLANIYAYGAHAEVPAIAIEPNVYTLLIPYGFNTKYTGMRPAAFIAAWKQKAAQNSRGPLAFGLYDYWAYTTAAIDRPAITPAFSQSRLQTSHRHGIQDFVGESSYGSGAVGLSWYLAGRFAWEPNMNSAAAIDEWHTRAFGAAAPAMRRFFEVLHSRTRAFLDGQTHTSDPWMFDSAWAHLATAQSLADSPERRTRVAHFRGYLKHVQNMYDYDLAAAAEKSAAADRVLTHAWRLARTGMVHSAGVHYTLGSNEADFSRWTPSPQPASGSRWAQVRQLGAYTDNDLTQLGPVGAAVPALEPVAETWLALSPTALVPLATPPTTLDATIDTSNGGLRTHWDGTYPFHAQAGQSVTLTVKVDTQGWGQRESRVIIRAPDGTERITTIPLVKEGASSRVLTFTANTTGTHVLRYESSFNELSKIEFPRNLPFARMLGDEITFWVPERRQHFFVPAGTRRFALVVDCDANPKFYDVTGAVVSATRYGKSLAVDVPPGTDNRAWSFDGVCGQPRLLGVPPVIANNAAQLMVPGTTR